MTASRTSDSFLKKKSCIFGIAHAEGQLRRGLNVDGVVGFKADGHAIAFSGRAEIARTFEFVACGIVPNREVVLRHFPDFQ